MPAARFYVSVFKGSKITSVDPMSVAFELAGQPLIALNGGPHYKLTPAFSLFVSVKTQPEVDELWQRLTADGGREVVRRHGLDPRGAVGDRLRAGVLARKCA